MKILQINERRISTRIIREYTIEPSCILIDIEGGGEIKMKFGSNEERDLVLKKIDRFFAGPPSSAEQYGVPQSSIDTESFLHIPCNSC